MRLLLIGLSVLPLLTAAACLILSPAIARWLSPACAAACLAMVLPLVGRAGGSPIQVGFLRADALSVVFVLATAFLYLVTCVYCLGYLDRRSEHAQDARYLRLFYIGLNLFAWSMLCAPLMDGLALLWVAIEITTVVSALLVAIENTDGATEAAWKYILIASAGLGIALLATVFMYYAGAHVLGAGYDLSFSPLLAHAGDLPATAVRIAYALALLGFGTKVGLVPVHTWLPDAHAEAPTPISAMLSGSLLAVSFYAVMRYYQVAVGALGPRFPQALLLGFGIASLLLSSLCLLGQKDVKRLLAYSSVEHMGILSIGLSFGVPLAFAGVLLHVLAHAAAKGGAFMGAGVLVRAYGTKDLAKIRDGLSVLPWSAPLMLLLVLGLSGFPPAGIFRSEFQIVVGGITSSGQVGAIVLVALVTVAFMGLAIATTRMLCQPGRSGVVPEAGEPSRWMVAALLGCLAALVVLGLHPPGDLTSLLSAGAQQLSGAAP
jgi:hydrogenase-4 component F